MSTSLKSIFLTILMVSISGFSLYAQGSADTGMGTLSGVVIDDKYKDILPYSHVKILGLDRGLSTDGEGKFKFENIPYGSYQLEISFLGYEKRIVDVHITEEVQPALSIELKDMAITTDEVVITASKREQQFSLAPASIGLVTAKQIEEKALTSFDQAFDHMNGLAVTRSSGSNVQAVSIRGASEVAGGGVGNRVLLLIDGRPALSPDSGGALWNLVPLSSVERIEVVKGAYSSLFGSSAMGGVVNVITKKPDAQTRTNFHFNYGFFNGAPASTGYDKFNDYYTLAMSRSGRSGDLSYIFDASFRSTDGHREKTAFDLFNFYGKFKYRFSGQRSLTFSGNYNLMKNDTPATWLSARQAYSVADFRKDDFQDRRETNADLFYEAIASENLKYSSRFYLYQNDSEFTFNADPGNDSTNVNTSQTIAASSVLSRRFGNVSQVDWYSDDNHYVIAGIETYYDLVNGVPDTVLYGKHNAFNIGFYLQDELSLNDRLTITGGLRYDYYSISDEFSEGNLSPKIAATYKWSNRLTSRALIAQAYRNPSIAERFIKFEQGGGLTFEPNPDLQSERLNLSLELGSQFKFTDELSLDFAVFYNQYENLISFQQLSNSGEALLYKVINLKESIMQGFEGQFTYRHRNGLNIHMGYTFLDARDVSENRVNDNLAYKFKHSAHFSIDKAYKGWTLNFNGRYRSAIKEVFIYPGNEPDAYILMNSRLAYKFSEGHTAYFSLQNIGDVQYEELERYRMAGRSFTMGAMVEL
jgi:outer membrane receptor for ferrienterochelin and colicin